MVDLNDPPEGEMAELEVDLNPPCVLVFNASDPSGAGGLGGDALAIASVGAHMLGVVTGAYARDTAEVFDHFAFDEEAVAEQTRAILEDVEVQLIKVGFVGSPETLSTIAETATDYPDVPVVAYMPNLSWWDENQIESYLDAFRELVLPQTTVLVGNHSTLWRWLLPDWAGEKPPTARDIARAAGEQGTPYTLVTGIMLPDQFIDNVLASPQSVLASEKYERLEAVFAGAGDTLSAALAALLASGTDLPAAASEALSYMDRCLDAGFRPGMGHVLPDRLFWAQPEDEDDDDEADEPPDFALPPHDTRH
ncbi:bifunctional hydroxymethylpyrimidine kinase/phosphomethylpyrimidine kinase [Variovorax guangxiensis]|uniref:Hydroxymethylpyrimidine/phosphomethylpyrimidine kinase n=1 Tax=Variovorax guangxiensis TaxID=1775474 RepID=A0A502DII0_9BURK|nr:bifunctional hydroxymethylpyrimidine kinase/phosphomethylpyrimidine kinase [Variovorax guangxiensis]RZI68551.1 MAG: hydroxymethylpyrimidine/phosphomethylpyrimidine kinase [Variovorax sp.]TPG21276.1 hydroxymethylpyrimidine/phosphomethylpyrimidine kinase [Variovorax ginsengisoli]TPG25325.1 hydroxymethylpyrimidine/phosphomethylpyrimidine kinase [Variovorax guangxiensis]